MRSRTLSEGRKDGLPEAHSREQPLSTQDNPMMGRNNIRGRNSASPSIQLSTKGKMSGPQNSSGLTIIRKLGHNIDYTSLRETTYGQILVGDTSELDEYGQASNGECSGREFLLHFLFNLSAHCHVLISSCAVKNEAIDPLVSMRKLLERY